MASLLALLGHAKLLGDPDTFWHIAVGRKILETGQFPVTDEFTYSFAGQSWLANQWLSECGLALLDRWTGFDGVLAVAIGLLAGFFTLIGARCARQGWHWLFIALLLTLIFGASAYNFVARPHLTTMFLLPLVFAWLVDIEAGRRSLRTLACLPFVTLLWANLHGGVLGGLATIALVAAGWLARWQWGSDSPIASRRDAAWLVGSCAAAAAALCVNPYGMEMFGAWRAILAMDLPHLVIEHARLDPRRPEGIFAIGLGLTYIVALGLTPRRDWRVTWLIPIAWLFLAFSRIRHAPLFAGLAGVALAEIVSSSAWRARLAGRGWLQAERSAEGASWRWSVGLGAVFALALATAGLWHVRQPQQPLLARPLPRVWPADVGPVLARLPALPDRPLRLFNDQLYGGYLIYEYPAGRVFIDGRCELHGERRLREYLEAQRDTTIVERWLEEAPADVAVVRRDTPFDRYFASSKQWRQVATAGRATVYARDGLALDPLSTGVSP